MSLDTTRGQHIGNYELLTKIAEGGMGAVYKARSVVTGQVVAIKIVPPETAKNPLLLKRFEQEFKAACLIDHPNVVKALDFCGTGPSPFLVMEFVDGGSLGQRVERDGQIPEAEAVRYISQVCEGLHRAHKQGLIHRDVKPDNILVTRDGVAKLTDLGLVKDVEAELNLTRTGRGLGTPHFMAPEQFRNAKAADVRCDVYSLGATLYMLVTGEIPFARTSPLDCWMKKIKNDFPEPRKFAPHLSDRTNWAICRAMSADPAQRPSSCREFMEDLTGGNWRTTPTAPVSPTAATAPHQAVADDLWYMVYRDEAGVLHTVKGSTESVRRNVASGALGDAAAILVSQAKTGPFVPLRTVPEFRDLVVASTPLSDSGHSTGRLLKTAFVPPGRDDLATPPPAGQTTRSASKSGRLSPLPGSVPSARMPAPVIAPPPPSGRLARPAPGGPPESPFRKPGPAWLPWLALLLVAVAFGVGLAFFLK